MRDVLDHKDLARLLEEQRGFIVNIREDRKKVHRAGCESVGAMLTSAYQKVFFEDEDAEVARQWLNERFGTGGWVNCGLCRGIGRESK